MCLERKISKNLQVPFRRLKHLEQIHRNYELLTSHHAALSISLHIFTGRMQAESWNVGLDEAAEQMDSNRLLPLIVNIVTVLKNDANISSNIRQLSFNKKGILCNLSRCTKQLHVDLHRGFIQNNNKLETALNDLQLRRSKTCRKSLKD